MSCKSIKPNVNKVCTADLNNRIKIQYRSIAPVNSPDSNLAVSFTDVISCWAMIKTGASSNWIDGVNAGQAINTDFFIRWTASVDFTREIWVLFDDVRFKIFNIDNIDKQENIIRLRSVEKGSKDINANAV